MSICLLFWRELQFPGNVSDLEIGELWHAPENTLVWSKQLFAYDLDVIAWDSTTHGWSTHPRQGWNKNDDYLVWDKPIYTLADGIILHWENGIEDNLNPDPTGQQFSGSGLGNVFFIQHGDEVVRYAI